MYTIQININHGNSFEISFCRQVRGERRTVSAIGTSKDMGHPSLSGW